MGRRRELRVGVGGELAEFDPRPSFGAEWSADVGLEREQAGLLLAAVGEELLGTADLGVAIEILDAARPAPAQLLRLDELEPALAALAEEARADRAVGFELVVMIVGIAAAGVDLAEEPAERDFGAGIVASLFKINGRRFGLDRRIERVTDRNSVFLGVAGDRETDVQIAVDISGADRAFARAGFGIGQLAFEIGERLDVGVGAGERLLAQGLGEDMAADFEVVGVRGIAVRMNNEMAGDRDVDRDIARAFVGRAAVLGEGVYADNIFGNME